MPSFAAVCLCVSLHKQEFEVLKSTSFILCISAFCLYRTHISASCSLPNARPGPQNITELLERAQVFHWPWWTGGVGNPVSRLRRLLPLPHSPRCSSFHKAFDTRPPHSEDMAPAMKSAMKSKAMKTNAKAMTKAQLADQLATKSELKKKDVLSVLQNLSEIGANEVTNTGKHLASSSGLLPRPLPW